jgi:hypothetical protein
MFTSPILGPPTRIPLSVKEVMAPAERVTDPLRPVELAMIPVALAVTGPPAAMAIVPPVVTALIPEPPAEASTAPEVMVMLLPVLAEPVAWVTIPPPVPPFTMPVVVTASEAGPENAAAFAAIPAPAPPPVTVPAFIVTVDPDADIPAPPAEETLFTETVAAPDPLDAWMPNPPAACTTLAVTDTALPRRESLDWAMIPPPVPP